MSVTCVLPDSPRAVPSHVRTYLPACTDVAIEESACRTGFGVSGTNAHVVLEEAPSQTQSQAQDAPSVGVLHLLLSNL